MTDTLVALELFDKPKNEYFTEDEKDVIRKELRRYNYKCHYSIREESPKKTHIEFTIDRMNGARRGKEFKGYKGAKIYSRDISDLEFEEEVANFGCNHRRFSGFYYRYIEDLIADDEKYGIETPKEFIEECLRKGYSKAKTINIK